MTANRPKPIKTLADLRSRLQDSSDAMEAIGRASELEKDQKATNALYAEFKRKAKPALRHLIQLFEIAVDAGMIEFWLVDDEVPESGSSVEFFVTSVEMGLDKSSMILFSKFFEDCSKVSDIPPSFLKARAARILSKSLRSARTDGG